VVARLGRLGISLEHEQSVDTSTSTGRLLLRMLGMVAGPERILISD
jgi:DNA invertase Pin-like site-specific DNA recombinase